MSEPAPETPTTAEPAPATEPASATPEPTAPQQEAAPAPAPASTVEELPAWAQKHLKELRTEAAASRTKAKEVGDRLATFEATQEQQRQAFARALGLAPDEPPTVEQLTAQLAASKTERDAEQARARQAAVELAVFRQAATQQVDGNALLDSRAFAATLDGLDPTASDFMQHITEAISAAAERQPSYKLAPPPAPAPVPPAPPAIPKSGAEFSAPPQGPRQWTEEDVAHATPSQLQKAINDGLCQDLGFGPRRGSRR